MRGQECSFRTEQPQQLAQPRYIADVQSPTSAGRFDGAAGGWAAPPPPAIAGTGPGVVVARMTDGQPLPMTDASADASESDAVDFSRPMDLVSPVDHQGMRDRWMDIYFVTSGKKPKNYTPQTMSLIARALRSYPAAWMRNSAHLPPFVYHKQCCYASMPRPLSHCLSLLRMYYNRAPGSDRLIADCLEREMQSLLEGVGSFLFTIIVTCRYFYEKR